MGEQDRLRSLCVDVAELLGNYRLTETEAAELWAAEWEMTHAKARLLTLIHPLREEDIPIAG